MKLLTFGCSWTKGVGIHYKPGMSYEEYNKDKTTHQNCPIQDSYSFRALLAERLGFENINYSQGASSNHRQERYATEYFNENSLEDTVVLWGITSCARIEIPFEGRWSNIMLNLSNPKNNKKNDLARIYFEHFYDPELEIERLGRMMVHWNKFFEGHNIKNLWFQTFNDYQFPQKIDRLVSKDLLTTLTRDRFRGTSFKPYRDEHFSAHNPDSKRIKAAINMKLVNPHTLHPTQKTHVKIADILEPHLREIL